MAAPRELPAVIGHRIDAHEIELIRFLWVDHNGICRGKAVSRHHLAERLVAGIGLAKCRQAANAFDSVQPVPGFGAVGEVRLVPDPETFVTLPHAPGSAAMLCDLVDVDGTPWDACPRRFLKEAIADAAALGFDTVAAFEPEFTMFRRKPTRDGCELFDDALCFDVVGFDDMNDFAVDLARRLGEQGVDIELYHPEFGAGQHEMTCRYAPALQAADRHVWQKTITRGMAMRHGHWASFAPLPMAGMRGNGNHIHLSLWRDGANAFHDPADPLGLSATGYHFIGGILAHAGALTALTCSSVNSYRRLRPGMWSGAYACYGPDNREAAVRIPSRLFGRESASTNLEYKPCDGTANPYLALGAVLAAGLDGVRRRLHPGAALADDPNRLSPGALRERGVHVLPGSLQEALALLERDDVLQAALGPTRCRLLAAIRRSDIAGFSELDEPGEFLHYSTRY
jgi:glutamine synthetase